MLQEVGTYLAANGIGAVGTVIYLGFLPTTPDACCALYHSGGQAPVRAMRSGPGQAPAVRPRLQVVCRDTEFEYQAADTLAKSIGDLLDGLGDVTLSGVKYFWIGAVADRGLMGRDDAGRVQIVQNFDVIKEPS